MHLKNLLPLRYRLIPGIKWSVKRFNGAISTSSHTFDIRQGGTVCVNFPQSATQPLQLEIVSAWQDFVVLDCDISTFNELNIVNQTDSQILTISPKSNSIGKFRLTVPQSIDLAIAGDELQCSIKNKVEGDVSIECNKGSIDLDKVRGMNVVLHLGHAALNVEKLLEGNVSIVASSVSAKMVNGDNVQMSSAGDIKVGAIYAEQCRVHSSGHITLGGMKGQATVYSERGNVSVAGIDGSFDVLADQGSVTLQINKLSAAPSFAVATKGGIVASVDPEVQATLRCQSHGIAGRARVTIISDAFESDPSAHSIAPMPGLAIGRLTGKSTALKHPPSASAARSGKIDLVQADRQSLGGSSSNPISAHTADSQAFDLSLTAYGHVRVETLSWVEAIRRKYGFLNDSEGTRPVGPGRTASASQRAKEIK